MDSQNGNSLLTRAVRQSIFKEEILTVSASCALNTWQTNLVANEQVVSLVLEEVNNQKAIPRDF